VRLRGRGLVAARISWFAVAVLSTVVFVAGVPYQFSVLMGARRDADVALSGIPDGVLRSFLEGWVFTGAYPYLALGIEACLAVSMSVVAVFIYWQMSDDRLAWLASVTLFSYAAVWTGFGEALAAAWPPWWAAAGLLEATGLAFSITLFFAFPDGRFVPPWTRYVAVVWVGWSVYWTLGPLTLPGLFPLPLEQEFFLLSTFPTLAFNLLAIAVQVYRYRRVSSDDERRRTRWVVLSFAVGTAVYFAVNAARIALSALGEARVAGFLHHFVGVPLVQLSLLLIPLCVLLAIVRRRLFGIEVIVNRALVYAALTACVIGIYVLVVGYLGALLRTGSTLPASLVATGIVAVLFQPLRDRLQRAANRMVYGDRDEPYAVLSRLGQRLEATLASGSVLPTIVETVVEGMKVPHAEIFIVRDGSFESAARCGVPTGDPLVLLLSYQNETVGRIEVSPRARDEPFAPADLRLLQDLARQAGVAVHAVRLTDDLQRSRERMVIAREEERLRLRRDLHDGVGPQLAALTLKIETARNKLIDEPGADVLLSDLAERARDAVADVRRSVHALRPPALDELGLVPALRETAAQHSQNGLSISVEVPGDLAPLSAAVEVAAYRIAQEAITNVVRHANARNCEVRFDLDEASRSLKLEVTDDGRGIGKHRGLGVGLYSMRERAEELGGSCIIEDMPSGGTRVNARLPLSDGASRSENHPTTWYQERGADR
jgi:signal transduction histidine kinase